MDERPLVSFDYAVKYLLRGKSQEDFVILSGFLSELMRKDIKVMDILESESNKVDPGDKTNRVELKARIDDGELAVFEIQFLQESDFFGKVLYGVSRAIVEQVSAGKLYNIRKVHSINIVYYNMTAKREYLFFGKFGGFKGVHFEDESISFAQAADKNTKELVDIHPEYHLILPNMFDGQLRDHFDEWMFILKNSKVREGSTAAGIKEAEVKLDLLNMSSDDRRTYERYMDSIRSSNSLVIQAQRDGEAIGEARGRAEGRTEGEANNARKVAKNMKAEGMDVEIIARLTGLMVDEVLKL
jgi:predicted transposase/invertase (TIGR01784 family)